MVPQKRSEASLIPACAISCPWEDGCPWKQPEYSTWSSPKHWANTGNDGDKRNVSFKTKCERDNVIALQGKILTSLSVKLALIRNTRSKNRRSDLAATGM